MKASENDKWLDEALFQALGSEKIKPNFDQWKENHPDAINKLSSRTGPVATDTSRPAQKIGRMIMNNPITKLAAAAVIIIAVVIGIHLGTGSNGSGLAFAEVIKHMQGSSYAFDLTFIWPQAEQSRIVTRAMVSEPGRLRLETSVGSLGKITSVINLAQNRCLLIFHKNQAVEILENPVPDVNAGVGGFFALCNKSIDNLWNLRDGSEEKLGQKEINGQPVEGFKVTQWDEYCDYEITIWAHAETAEPVVVVIDATSHDEDKPAMKWTMDNFDLDAELDESLFSLEPPAGYTITHQKDLEELNEQAEASAGAEQITEALALWSEGQKEQALEMLTGIDWNQSFEFGGDDYLFTMTEKQYIALKPDDQQIVMKKIMPASSEIRKISKELINRAQQAISDQDSARAERYLYAGLQLGNLLNRDPDAMLIVRLVGIAIQRLILPEMITLYTKTGEQQKLQTVQKQLQQAEAEIEQIKRDARGN